MSELTNIQDPATIRVYFEKVRELAKSGVRFPSNLDEVWPLVYAEKGVAIRALKKNFIENVDFEVFDQNVKNLKGGRPEMEYWISVSCLEYFIVRKVRSIFEPYRQVFHQVADQIEHRQSVAALTEDEIVRQALLIVNRENVVLKEENQTLKVEKQALTKKIEAVQPVVDYTETVLNTRDTLTTSTIAADLGWSAIKLNQVLKSLGVQYKQDGTWTLTYRYKDRGYTRVQTTLKPDSDGKIHAYNNTVWTQRGRAFIWHMIKTHYRGELPALLQTSNKSMPAEIV